MSLEGIVNSSSRSSGTSEWRKRQTADTGPKLKELIERYQTKKSPVNVNFRRLIPELNSIDRYTHLIHPYPAKLLAHIPAFFLANNLLSQPGDSILDPFCGSGTVLLESVIADRNGIGVDVNPLAELITRVKTTPIDCCAVEATMTRLLARVPSQPPSTMPDVVNIEHWFYPHVVRQLSRLLVPLKRIRNPQIRDFLFVCFSVCVRKVSLADPRLSVPVRLKKGQYPPRHPLRQATDAHFRRLKRINVTNVFTRIVQENLKRMRRLEEAAHSQNVAHVSSSDARDLRTRAARVGSGARTLDESIDLIITSPPYPGAQKYIRSCSLSLGWLGLCPTSHLPRFKKQVIGREETTSKGTSSLIATGIEAADNTLSMIYKRDPVRATIAATYLVEMRAAIKEMHRVLSPNGHIVLVAANNRVAQRRFYTVDYLCSLAIECGLVVTASFVDAIKSRGLMTRRNHTAGVIAREHVLLLSKGGLPRWAK